MNIISFDFSYFKNLVAPIRELFRTLFFSVKINGVSLGYVLFFFWLFALFLAFLTKTRTLPSASSIILNDRGYEPKTRVINNNYNSFNDKKNHYYPE